MSKELASQLTVTKFDITERMKPGWPRHFHYEAQRAGMEFPVGYISVRHWLAEQRAEIDEISVDNSGRYGSGDTVAIGQFMVRACAHDLRNQGLHEFRLQQPNGAEFSMIHDVFGEDHFDVTAYNRDFWPAPDERQLVQLPAAELLARCLREQDQYEPTDEAMELWVSLDHPATATWPIAQAHPHPVYL